MLIHTFCYKLRSNKKLSRVKKFDLTYSTPGEIDNIADKLRFYRHQNKLSQNDLACLLNVDRTVYSRYESGKNDYCPIDRMQKVADFYQIPITDLLDEYNLFIYHGQAEGFKQLRKSLCLSLSDVAERLNVNLAVVKRWSQEVTRLPKSALEQLLDMKKAVNR